jgi:MFS transporter, OPA family, sugar phosphate sensor protein UhpC
VPSLESPCLAREFVTFPAMAAVAFLVPALAFARDPTCSRQAWLSPLQPARRLIRVRSSCYKGNWTSWGRVRLVASASPSVRPGADSGSAPLAGAPGSGASDGVATRTDLVYSPAFVAKRRIVFVGMSAMYAIYVALRATWTFVSPVAAAELGLSLNQVGFIASSFPLLYGVSRLITGVLADRSSPAKALGVGLGLAGVLNVGMSLVSRPSALAGLWGFNGLVQGVGAGASAKLLTAWHSRKERGFWWAIWSSTANLGGFLAPVVCGYLASTRLGFRAGLLIPGLFAMAVALLVTPMLRDSPADAGFIAPWAREEMREQEADARASGADASVESLSRKLTLRESLVEGVLRNRRIWALAVSYFFVYFLRFGMRSWFHFYLVEARAIDVVSAAYRVSGMEVGGVAGTLVAGIASDALDGRRVAVTIVYLAGLAVSLCLTAAIPSGGSPVLDIVAFSLLGFFINGPQCLIGLIGAEVSDARVVATATGVLGWISYGGAAASGLPLSILVRTFGWQAFFICMVGASIAAAVVLLPMAALRGRPSEKRS